MRCKRMLKITYTYLLVQFAEEIKMFNSKSFWKCLIKNISNFFVLFLAWDTEWTRIYFVWILTFCIIFQFKSNASANFIRMKMNKEVVAWRGLVRWQGITTIWISKYGWCIWTTVIDSQIIIIPDNRRILLVWTKLTIDKVVGSKSISPTAPRGRYIKT